MEGIRGRCARCNGVEEADGWRVHVARASPLVLETRTPSGHRYRSSSPPLLGWGTDPPPAPHEPESVLEHGLESLLRAA